ncbi:MAG: methylisocitrate lyase [Agarilytica sp.]
MSTASAPTTPGAKFRQALAENDPLQIVGTINAYTAIMAERIGHRAVYLSGGACANMSFGLPDLGMTNLMDVVEDARRITAAVDTPLMVDIDTGWGGAFNIARAVKEMERAQVAAVHIEDQVAQKRCGHRPNKEIVRTCEMVDRIKAAVDARKDSDFFIVARTDAYASEGLSGALERANEYQHAGADGIFAEAMHDIHEYKAFKSSCTLPLLANMTEFGQSPLYSKPELKKVGVNMVLYPLTAARAMNRAAENVYKTLLDEESQSTLIESMQTRQELYQYLNYNEYESKLDTLFSQGKHL